MNGLELRSTITSAGELRLELIDVDAGTPAPDEVVVRIEAAPINPSDLGLLFGPASLDTIKASGTRDRPVLTMQVPEKHLGTVTARLDQSMAVGNEGAGTVVEAGAQVQSLMGKTVGMVGGAMYAQYRRIRASEVIELPEGASSAHGASMFVNPLTALGFIETMKRDGHTALVHTAAASNLGQMLQRVCAKDGIPLVNIVRSEAQADILRGCGATEIVDSSAPDYRERLTAAIAKTGATVGFDATGGGKLASEILNAMETVAGQNSGEYSRYGTTTFKQVYIYGGLDTGPTVLNRGFGFAWSLGGWLLFPFLEKAGPEIAARMRQRVADELKSTFASNYTATISLADALNPDMIGVYQKKATGEKYLIDPTL